MPTDLSSSDENPFLWLIHPKCPGILNRPARCSETNTSGRAIYALANSLYWSPWRILYGPSGCPSPSRLNCTETDLEQPQ